MKDPTKDKIVENQTTEKLPVEIKPVPDEQNLDKHTAYEHTEKDLNEKILKITMKIKDHYPELSKYLDEMPVTVPSEKDPEMSINLLREYYESLHSVLNQYQIEYPKIEE